MAGISDLGYINARIHGLRSYLLPKSRMESFSDLSSLGELIEELRESSYREFIQRALISGDQLHAIDVTLNEYLGFIAKKILSITGEEPHEIYSLIFLRWDYTNLKIALRGLTTEVRLDRNLIPYGQLGLDELANIAASSTLQEAYNWLQTYRSPISRAIRPLLEYPFDLFQLDTALDQSYFLSVIRKLNSLKDQKNAQIALDMIYEEVELRNVLNLFQIMSKMYNNILLPIFDMKKIIFPKRVGASIQFLNELIQNRNIGGILEICKLSSYRHIFEVYPSIPALIEDQDEVTIQIEIQFVKNQIRKAHKGVSDMNLGIAYIWQLFAETRNLRLIAHGIFGFMHPDDIRRYLVFGR
ncbi:MAG: hypothetical protein EAX86_10665 [Candidatus Heimdallarchaeota archaeon]|nr:hypothetical protein [Candidatus Heimdallarchaeota archaeon]